MPGNRENKGQKKEGVSLIYDTPFNLKKRKAYYQ